MKERNYGIDLLRLIFMYMVCMLHTLGQGGVLGKCSSSSPYWLLEVFSYCAVDGFALISGYMANTSTPPRQKYHKIVNMWFQAIFYSFFVTLILTLFGINKNWGKRDIIQCLLPVTYGKFWYFTAYFALFFAIPILNRFICSIEIKTAKKAFLILVVMFSIIGVIKDPFKTNAGYSAIWLIVMYCMGALAKKIQLFKYRKTAVLICIWVISVLATWASFTLFPHIPYISINAAILLNYTSPTILLNAIIMVVLFSRLHLNGKFIAKLSPLAFGIYLFQMNQVIWNDWLYDAFGFLASKNIIIGIIYAFALALAIFVCGLIVEYIRSKIATLLKIPELSKKIVSLANKLLEKSFVLLK